MGVCPFVSSWGSNERKHQRDLDCIVPAQGAGGYCTGRQRAAYTVACSATGVNNFFGRHEGGRDKELSREVCHRSNFDAPRAMERAWEHAVHKLNRMWWWVECEGNQVRLLLPNPRFSSHPPPTAQSVACLEYLNLWMGMTLGMAGSIQQAAQALRATLSRSLPLPSLIPPPNHA